MKNRTLLLAALVGISVSTQLMSMNERKKNVFLMRCVPGGRSCFNGFQFPSNIVLEGSFIPGQAPIIPEEHLNLALGKNTEVKYSFAEKGKTYGATITPINTAPGTANSPYQTMIFSLTIKEKKQ